MLKREFLEQMQKDEELQMLRKRVLEITGKRKDIVYIAGKYSIEEFKMQLSEIIKEHDATQS